MALFRGPRSCTAFFLALSFLFRSFPAFPQSLKGGSLESLFDSGARPQALFVPRDDQGSASPIVRPRPVSAAVSFNGLELPSHIFSRDRRISKTLVVVIDRTRRKMDLALYVIRQPDVAEAILRARERGVVVRIIVDHQTTFPTGSAPERSKELDRLIRFGVPIATLRGGIMHNKFGIFDGRLVASGSFNWTERADTRHFENVLFRDQAEFSAGFGDYFNWMWIQATPLSGFPFPVRNRQASDDIEPTISFKGRAWPSFSFSPEGGTEQLIIKAINLCRKSLDIAMFSFFSKDIAEAVIRAKNRGVAVRVVLDKGNARNFLRERGFKGVGASRNEAKKLLRRNGIDLKFSFGKDGPDGVGVLHHKFALFDAQLLATGSFNYSENADDQNYENTIFSTEEAELRGFRHEFELLYNGD